ncbi:hypothetical protein ACFQV2_12620 [Actinokineospora soli]|uniref:Tetratricopeptide repeat-containing protein n=1 Tax=Actinokineospora soli TaxID=1048753 RepID=A0ABW2TMJ2_9PSEU
MELLARAGPLALLVEDLHLADASSLELTAYVGRRLTRLPVLLVLTRRDLPPRPAVDAVLSALRARGALVADLALGPLPDQLVRGLVGPGSDVDRIVELAAGSPLIAVQMARAPAGAGLRDAVRHTVGRLSAPARLVTELLAVAGRDLGPAEVAALQVPDPTRAATEALGAGLLRVRGEAIGFRHALLSEAVYADLAEPLRARLHADVADALRRRPRRQAAEIARHLLLAGQDRAAATHLITAAAHARTIAALTEAADFLAQAIAIDPDDPDPHVELAEVQAWRGLRAESDAAFARALELIPARDTGALAAAWLRRGRWLRGVICDPRESRRSYRGALDAEPDQQARAEALAGMAWAESVAGDPAAVDGLLAGVTGDLDDLLAHDVGIARAHALLRAGRFAAAYEPLVAAAAAANRAGRPDMAYACLSNAATAAACAGEFDRALDFADRCLPLVLSSGLLRLAVHTCTARATVLRRLGRLAEARASCDQAAGLADRVGQPDLIGLVHHERGLLAHAEGDWDTAAAELATALSLPAPVSTATARLRRADALARGGRPDDAEAELRAVVREPVSPSDFPDTLVARMSAVQARIALCRGDPDLAARRLDEARRGWLRRVRGPTGAEYAAVLVDLGRPPISAVVEPERELAEVTALLDSLGRTDAALR